MSVKMAKQSVKWDDLDTDDIQSIISEDLAANRPNRSKLPKSTWLELTQEERGLWRSMQRLEDSDLAIHLYNAFSLKQMAQDETKQASLKVVDVSFSLQHRPHVQSTDFIHSNAMEKKESGLLQTTGLLGHSGRDPSQRSRF